MLALRRKLCQLQTVGRKINNRELTRRLCIPITKRTKCRRNRRSDADLFACTYAHISSKINRISTQLSGCPVGHFFSTTPSDEHLWTKYKTDDGHIYWYNSDTKESTWEDPCENGIQFADKEPIFEKIYAGAFADAVKYLKVISLTSCGFTLLAAPLLVIAGDESLTLATRLLISTGIAGTGIFSTAILNWTTSPYVIDMVLEDNKTLHLRTRTLFGRLVPHQFPLTAIEQKVGGHPFAVFSAEGRNFYVDSKAIEDVNVMTTLELIQEEAKKMS